MTRFHIRREAVRGDRVTFDAAETRHLSRVLRLRPGDVVRAVDGRGRQLTIALTHLRGRSAQGAVLSDEVLVTEPSVRLTLAQAIPKADKLEGIIRMATELGVARVVPLITDRTVVRREPARWAARGTRWERVAREAAKQCGRAVIPEVTPPSPLGAWLADRDAGDLFVCLWEGEQARLMDRLPPGPVAGVALLVGPEGGLTEDEVARIRAAGAIVAGLGPRVLRTETAGPVGLALLQARYGDFQPRHGGDA